MSAQITAHAVRYGGSESDETRWTRPWASRPGDAESAEGLALRGPVPYVVARWRTASCSDAPTVSPIAFQVEPEPPRQKGPPHA